MRKPYELHAESPAVARAVDELQRVLGTTVLALILVDADGTVSGIPNPNLPPGAVFRGIAGQNWEAAARIAEEFAP